MANNAVWLDRLEYIPFLREYGRHFSVNRMLSFDSVRLRLEREQPLSFLEFNYMVLAVLRLPRAGAAPAAAPCRWAARTNGATSSAASSSADASGIIELFGVTSPLITTASGAKMGKTAQGAVWLNAERLAPYDYWQFWRNTEDADVGRFLRLFTESAARPRSRGLEALGGSEINEAKEVLATEATALCHGRAAAEAAAETARRVFAEGGIGDDLPVTEMARVVIRGRAARDRSLPPRRPGRQPRRGAPPHPRRRRPRQ